MGEQIIPTTLLILPLISGHSYGPAEEMDDVHLHICISIFSLLANVAIRGQIGPYLSIEPFLW